MTKKLMLMVQQNIHLVQSEEHEIGVEDGQLLLKVFLHLKCGKMITGATAHDPNGDSKAEQLEARLKAYTFLDEIEDYRWAQNDYELQQMEELESNIHLHIDDSAVGIPDIANLNIRLDDFQDIFGFEESDPDDDPYLDPDDDGDVIELGQDTDDDTPVQPKSGKYTWASSERPKLARDVNMEKVNISIVEPSDILVLQANPNYKRLVSVAARFHVMVLTRENKLRYNDKLALVRNNLSELVSDAILGNDWGSHRYTMSDVPPNVVQDLGLNIYKEWLKMLQSSCVVVMHEALPGQILGNFFDNLDNYVGPMFDDHGLTPEFERYLLSIGVVKSG